MHEQIEVIYENGVLRPLRPLPSQIRDHQHLTVTIIATDATDPWLADANPAVSLEAVRQALAKAPGTLAEMVHAERQEW
jgi:predicted DNA-binding antitoxin AbrB/MazE fold protein